MKRSNFLNLKAFLYSSFQETFSEIALIMDTPFVKTLLFHISESSSLERQQRAVLICQHIVVGDIARPRQAGRQNGSVGKSMLRKIHGLHAQS